MCLQVGSKNAAFFMGGCTKVVTKNAHSSFVHELSLAAGELEERYRKQQVLLLLLQRLTSDRVAVHKLTCHRADKCRSNIIIQYRVFTEGDSKLALHTGCVC